MDFSKATFDEAPTPTRCAVCAAPLLTEYWTAGNAMVCANCGAQLRQGPPPEGAIVRVFKALLGGCGAGLLGAVGYGLIIHFANMELALVTILIGWMVGRSVRWGSEGRGGRGYQALGAFLTYVWCMMAYVPDIALGMDKADAVSPIVHWVLAPFIALAVPFTGEMGFLGTLILGFGVWRGWREPVKVELAVDGPFSIGAAPPAPLTAAP